MKAMDSSKVEAELLAISERANANDCIGFGRKRYAARAIVDGVELTGLFEKGSCPGTIQFKATDGDCTLQVLLGHISAFGPVSW